MRCTPHWYLRSGLALGLVLTSCGENRDEQLGSSGLTSVGDGSGTDGDGSDGSNGGDGGDGGDESAGDDTSAKFDVPDGEGETGGDASQCPCADSLDGIYLLDQHSPPSVWFYDPQANSFQQVGVLGCSAPGWMAANSMGIDRTGHAVLNYRGEDPQSSVWSGRMYRARLDDLSDCEDLGYEGEGEWFLLGLGFASRGEDEACDDLYVYNSDKYVDFDNASGGSFIGQWDFSMSSIDELGATDYPVAELTGTGDGRLFAFVTTGAGTSALVEYEKDMAQPLEVLPLDSVDITYAFAFAFWGGDVYLFTESGGFGSNSKVTRVDLDENDGGGLEVVHTQAPLRVVGAGVSTCASFVPPG